MCTPTFCRDMRGVYDSRSPSTLVLAFLPTKRQVPKQDEHQKDEQDHDEDGNSFFIAIIHVLRPTPALSLNLPAEGKL